MTEPERYFEEEQHDVPQDYGDDPLFEFYAEFADDWDVFPRPVKKALGSFFEALQKCYGDPVFLTKCEQKQKYWGYALVDIGYKIIWRVVYPDGSTSINQRAEQIVVLAVDKI